MNTDKELADELDAKDRLRSRGYEWKPCVTCKGIALDYCSACQGKGGHWQAPVMRCDRKTRNIITGTPAHFGDRLKEISDMIDRRYPKNPTPQHGDEL